MYRETDGSQFFRQRFGIPVWHVDDQKVLHDGCAQIARSEALGEFRSRLQLLRTDASAQDGSPYKAEPFLFLLMTPNVVTVDIVRRALWLGGIELKTKHALQFSLESICGPAFAEEEKLQPRPFAMLAQCARCAEEFGHAASHVDDLIPAHERVQAHAQM